MSRLRGIGESLSTGDEAIYDTRPWHQAEAATTTGLPVTFTRKGATLYVTVIGRPTGAKLVVKDLHIQGSATVLADESKPLDGQFSPVIRVPGAGS